jgi:hypothetical protein
LVLLLAVMLLVLATGGRPQSKRSCLSCRSLVCWHLLLLLALAATAEAATCCMLLVLGSTSLRMLLLLLQGCWQAC